MSHKYYGFQKQEQDNLYTIPFLSTKMRRLRFLNNEFVAYGEKNEFVIHKNPGLTIIRLNDNQINRGLHNHSHTNKIMTEFLNQLVQSSTNLRKQQFATNLNRVNVKDIKVTSKSAIQITLKTY